MIKNTKLTDYARYHMKKLLSLSKKEMKQKNELPCSCEMMVLENLVNDYNCGRKSPYAPE